MCHLLSQTSEDNCKLFTVYLKTGIPLDVTFLAGARLDGDPPPRSRGGRTQSAEGRRDTRQPRARPSPADPPSPAVLAFAQSGVSRGRRKIFTPRVGPECGGQRSSRLCLFLPRLIRKETPRPPLLYTPQPKALRQVTRVRGGNRRVARPAAKLGAPTSREVSGPPPPPHPPPPAEAPAAPAMAALRRLLWPPPRAQRLRARLTIPAPGPWGRPAGTAPGPPGRPFSCREVSIEGCGGGGLEAAAGAGGSAPGRGRRGSGRPGATVRDPCRADSARAAGARPRRARGCRARRTRLAAGGYFPSRSPLPRRRYVRGAPARAWAGRQVTPGVVTARC